MSLEGDTDNHVFDTKRYRDPGGLRYLEMKDCDNDGHQDLWFLTSWGSKVRVIMFTGTTLELIRLNSFMNQ